MTEQQSEQYEDWELDPLLIQHIPTQDEINRSVALQAVQAMLFNGEPIDEQETYKQQANSSMKLALKSQGEERNKHLIKTLSLYNQAIDINVVESESISLDTIKQKQAILHSNRAEAFRLLKDFARASMDAQKATELDPNYFKGYLRLARICEDLNDYLRATYYYNKTLSIQSQPQLEKNQQNCKKQLQALEDGYKSIYTKFIQYYNTQPKLGLLLPFINMQLPQIFQSYQHNAASIYLLETKTLEILTVESFSMNSSIKDLKELIGIKNAKLYYETCWCDVFDGQKLIKQTNKDRKQIFLQENKRIKDIMMDQGYIIPGVICFYLIE